MLLALRGGEKPAPQVGASRTPEATAAFAHLGSEALAPRPDLRVGRERASSGDLPQPAALTAALDRWFSSSRDSRAVGTGIELARDDRVCHFRRRIPRMNSEEPPWS
jgi:hypothetical protein